MSDYIEKLKKDYYRLHDIILPSRSYFCSHSQYTLKKIPLKHWNIFKVKHEVPPVLKSLPLFFF